MLLLEDQGYDFWLEKVTFPTATSSILNLSIPLLEKLKHFIEVDMCKETKGVTFLNPNALRLLSKTSPLTLLGSNSDEFKPINYYDDT